MSHRAGAAGMPVDDDLSVHPRESLAISETTSAVEPAAPDRCAVVRLDPVLRQAGAAWFRTSPSASWSPPVT